MIEGRIVFEADVERDTKNSKRFAEVTDDGAVGTQYVQKSALKRAKMDDATRIRVTIERAD